MNIEKKQIDDLNLQLTIDIAPEDYADTQRKKLNDYKRKADIKGFRKGMAPIQLIKRIYGDQALYESVNGIVSEQLDKFIKDNQLHLLGEPLASEDQPRNEWNDGDPFTFKFDMGLSPKVDVDLSKEDKVPYYKIDVTKVAKEEMKTNMLRQFGSLEEGEAAGEDDYVIADLDNGTHKVEGAYISLRSVAEAARTRFLGVKAGDKFDINVKAAFENETDRAAMLKVKKEELEGMEPKFDVTIVNVKTFVPAEAVPETFDKMFEPGTVKTEEDFDKAVAERLRANYRQEADYRLSRDIRTYLVNKAGIELPEGFLKRWLLEANDGKFTREEIEKDFDSFKDDFKWQLVRGGLMDKLGLKIEDKDMQEAAEAYVAYQYAMYGMGNVPQQLIQDAARQVLSDPKQIRRIEENVEDQKVISAVRETITLEDKKISFAKFRDLK